MSDVRLEQLPLAFVGAAIGWCLGWLSGWLTEYLQRDDELPSHAHGPLVRDAWVQAATAVVAFVAALEFEPARAAALTVLSVPLIQVTVTDVRYRYVYTVVAGIGIALGLALSWFVQQSEWWASPLGAVASFLVFGALYLVGRLIYRGGEPLARGDMTIAAMVGAIAGADAARALFLGVVLSGVLAVGFLVLRRSRHAFMPYGPGLCVGGLVALFWRP